MDTPPVSPCGTGPKPWDHDNAFDGNLLQSLIHALPDRIYAKDTFSRFTLNNRAHLAALGVLTQEEALGKTDADFRPAAMAAASLADDQQRADDGRGDHQPRGDQRPARRVGGLPAGDQGAAPRQVRADRRARRREQGCHRAQAGRGGTEAGQPPAGGGDPRGHAPCRRSRAGERGEERVPRQHEPRDPDADERRHRHGRAAARHRPDARAAPVRRSRPRQRRRAPLAHQRHPGFLEDRGAQDGNRVPRFRSPVRGRERRRTARIQSLREGVAPGGVRRAERARTAPRRSRAPAPGAGQSGRQRRQVHRARRGRRSR